MPGWDETQNEFRYRVLTPDAFTPGTFFVKEFQKKPKIYAIMGRAKGTNSSSVQSLRFGKEGWTLEQAKSWHKDHIDIIKKATDILPTFFALSEREELQKNEDTDVSTETIAVFEKAGLDLLSLSFSASEFSKASIEKIIASSNLDVTALQKRGSNYFLSIRRESDFVTGSLRDILLREGLTGAFGKLKEGVDKTIEKKVPDRFELQALAICKLCDLNIFEVTLTAAPVVGKMSEWRITKSKSSDTQKSLVVPFQKFNIEKQQVFAYVLVPDIPDYQGDMLSDLEVEKAAHSFMRNLSARAQKGSGTGYEHSLFSGIGFPIETFIDHSGIYGVKGGWWLGTQVNKDETWQEIKAGKIIGYSIGGEGKREKAIIQQANETLTEKNIESKFAALCKKFFPDKTKKMATKETKQMKDVLEKFDLRPSEVEILKADGIDAKELYEAGEKFLKAMGLNLNNAGIGYTTRRLVDAVRSGKFGEYPANSNASWGSPALAKAVGGTTSGGSEDTTSGGATDNAGGKGKEKEDAEKNNIVTALKAEIDKLVGAVAGIMTNQGQMAQVLTGITKKVIGLEEAPDTRKSVDGAPAQDVQKSEDDNTWSPIESLDVPLD